MNWIREKFSFKIFNNFNWFHFERKQEEPKANNDVHRRKSSFFNFFKVEIMPSENGGHPNGYIEGAEQRDFNLPPPPSESKFKYLRKSTKDEFLRNGSFHEAIAPVITMAQFFGVMPVKGVREKSPDNLSFSWLNYRTIYSISCLLITIFDAILSLRLNLSEPFDFDTTVPIIYYGSVITANIRFLFLSQKWPQLMKKWQNVEKKLNPYKNDKDRRQLSYKIMMIVFLAMMLSLGEHLLNMVSTIHYANYCPTTKDPIVDFFVATNSQMFSIFEFSPWLALLGKIINIHGAFLWNFMDIFLMVISVGLSSRFKQLNDDLQQIKGKPMPDTYWAQRRLQFRELSILTGDIDRSISVITIVSFANNLYSICINLLKAMNEMPSFAHTIYFYYSLIYLLGRTLAVSLYSADIHEQSQKPIKVIRCIPNESWSTEAKRFADEVSNEYIALSGMGFFYLTRGMVLSVAGTIVTYELVLIQFKVVDRIWTC